MPGFEHIVAKAEARLTSTRAPLLQSADAVEFALSEARNVRRKAYVTKRNKAIKLVKLFAKGCPTNCRQALSKIIMDAVVDDSVALKDFEFTPLAFESKGSRTVHIDAETLSEAMAPHAWTAGHSFSKTVFEFLESSAFVFDEVKAKHDANFAKYETWLTTRTKLGGTSTPADFTPTIAHDLAKTGTPGGSPWLLSFKPGCWAPGTLGSIVPGLPMLLVVKDVGNLWVLLVPCAELLKLGLALSALSGHLDTTQGKHTLTECSIMIRAMAGEVVYVPGGFMPIVLHYGLQREDTANVIVLPLFVPELMREADSGTVRAVTQLNNEYFETKDTVGWAEIEKTTKEFFAELDGLEEKEEEEEKPAAAPAEVEGNAD